jgi:hypothetical protein
MKSTKEYKMSYLNLANDVINSIKEAKQFIQDESNPLNERYWLFAKIEDYLPAAKWISDWAFTDCNSDAYIEDLTDHRRGIIDAEEIRTCYIEELLCKNLTEDQINKIYVEYDFYLQEALDLADEETKEQAMKMVDALFTDFKSGAAIDW